MDIDTRTTIHSSAFCPLFHHAAELIGRRWTGAILRAMLNGVSHFNDFKSTIPDLSPRMLSERLKELEAEGILVRNVIPATPVRIEYQLTEKGRDLGAVVAEIEGWAHKWVEPECEDAPQP